MHNRNIDFQQIRHLAKLARLALSDEELNRLAGQLQSILGYVNKITQAEVSGVEPMAHVANLNNVLREDEVGETLPLDKVLLNAPETDGPFFKVPKVVGGDEDSAG